jgi:uncharacterized damage-inducible protein DinB
MEFLAESLKTAWRNHCAGMRILIEELDEVALEASSSTRGGRDVRAQLMHMHEIRLAYLGSYLKQVEDPPQPFPKGGQPRQAELLEAFSKSEDLLSSYFDHCIAKGGKVAGFKGGAVQMLGYFIAHESQHRGNILLTIKLAGKKIPDRLKWGIWDWNKI